MKFITGFLAIFCLISLISCDNDNNGTGPDDNTTVIVGSGNITTETPSLPEFHSVRLIGSGNIVIYSGATQAVAVDADDNVHEHLILSVNDGILSIETEDTISFSDVTITYRLMMTDLQKISVIGAGNVSTQGEFAADRVTLELIGAGNFNVRFNVDTLTTNLIGAGNFNITGAANKHRITLSGTGNIGSYNLATSSTIVIISGVGNTAVNVSDNLSAIISGVGSVYYHGHPTVNWTITGSGSIVDSNQ